MNIRTQAALCLNQVLQQQQSLTNVLEEAIAKCNDTDVGLLQELCYGVLRWYFRLDYIVKQLLQKPLKTKDQDIHCLLLLGCYQLLYMRVPPHAVLDTTVESARELKKPWATGLVNAILRRLQREGETIVANLKNESAIYAHPAWLLKTLQKQWPEQWQNIVAANEQHPPLTLRINQLQTSTQQYLTLLNEQQILAQTCTASEFGITLDKPQAVTELPGYPAGLFSVQDESAQLAATLLQLQPGLRVLEACAAPGGKTTHILETQTQLQELIALDNDKMRLQKIHENLQRLNLAATVIHGDATTSTWWDGQLFDRILLDAPCSATGVIRRHPDIKLLRRPQDIAELAAMQWQMLNALWPTLKQNGVLVYATCSIMQEEGVLQMSRFLQTVADAQEILIDANWGIKLSVGRQILTGEHNRDGFYYARIQKM